MIDEDRLREKVREPLERSAAPEPDLSRVRRRARALRARRVAGAVVAGLVLIAGVVVPLTILSSIRGGPMHPVPGAAGTSLHIDGISISLPDGWVGRAYTNPDATGPILQFANRPLEPLGAADDNVMSATRSQLGPGQAAVVLREVSNDCPCAGYRPHRLPISIEPRSCPCGFEGVDASHSFARVEFVTGGRWFDLW